MLLLWHTLVDMDKNIAYFQILVVSKVVFVSYAYFTVSNCCIGHYIGNYYVDIINRQFDRLFQQANMNLQEIFCTQTLCTVPKSFC